MKGDAREAAALVEWCGRNGGIVDGRKAAVLADVMVVLMEGLGLRGDIVSGREAAVLVEERRHCWWKKSGSVAGREAAVLGGR